ncbi:MAG: hypothetical protein ACKVJU_08465 [Verrucomicrobiales bacterium]
MKPTSYYRNRICQQPENRAALGTCVLVTGKTTFECGNVIRRRKQRAALHGMSLIAARQDSWLPMRTRTGRTETNPCRNSLSVSHKSKTHKHSQPRPTATLGSSNNR